MSKSNVVKTELVRTQFSGEDYLNLNDLVVRLNFDNKRLNAREEKSAAILLAVALLKEVVSIASEHTGNRFQDADVSSLLTSYFLSERDKYGLTHIASDEQTYDLPAGTGEIASDQSGMV